MKPIQLSRKSMLSRKILLAYAKEKNEPIYGTLQRLLRSSFITFMRGRDYADTLVIDLGSYNRRFYPKSINVDIFEQDTDIVTDITRTIPIESNSVDFIACTAVLGHVSDPKFVVSEILRILRKGGVVWCDIPFMQPYHSAPNDFQRFTLNGIRHLFRNFEIVESGPAYPNGFAMKWILETFRNTSMINGDLPNPEYPILNSFFSPESFDKFSRELTKMDLNIVNKYGDTFPENMHEVGNAFFVYCRKK